MDAGPTTVAPDSAFPGLSAEQPRVLRPAQSGAGGAVLAVLGWYGLVLLGSAVLIVLAFDGTTHVVNDTIFTIGCIGVFLSLTLAPVALSVNSRARRGADARLTSKLDRLADEIRLLSEQSTLSGDARRVLNRRAERDLLCRAIEEDIGAEDWDAGLVLCSELADRFGYRTEAEDFRTRIEAARSEIQDRKVADAIARLNGLIVQRRWDAAIREAARIARLFPDSPRVERLREHVDNARGVYKADLERRFLDAAGQDHIEEALGLLKELDGYLTESDAEPFREVARGVIGKARENLGAQFKIAVRDRQWSTAAAVGRRIINEFPNTRMATEVRDMLDGILARANSSAGV